MKTVFGFTFLQQIRSKTYIITTAVIGMIILALGTFGIKIADSFIGNDKVSDIERVFVCDTSVLSGSDYNLLHSSEDELYTGIVFENFDGTIEGATEKAASTGTHSAAVEVKNNDSGSFEIRVIKPEGFEADKKSADKLAEYIKDNLRYLIYEKSGLTDEQKTELLTKSEIAMSVAGGEGVSEDEEMLKNIIPVVGGLVLYMMLCLYGQNIARSVVLEKDSKMMETLLVMTKPYNMIFGKILGIYFGAILQLVIWIAAVSGGLAAGIASSDGAGKIIREYLGKFADKGGFSPAALALSITALLAGFLMYIAFAAFVGTFASKTEEVNNYYGIYTLVVIVCWMFPYINGLSGNDHLMNILRYIPFTAPFTAPADILLGNMNAVSGAVSTLLVVVTASVVVFFAAKVYKAFVLYRGKAPKLKDIIRTVKKES